VTFIKCCIKDCRNAATQEFRVAIPVSGHAIITMHMGLGACAHHKTDVKIEHFITDETKKIVNAMTVGKAPPDFDRAFIEWMTLH
jgi:hypothetical protein